jgi:hypothetical protein
MSITDLPEVLDDSETATSSDIARAVALFSEELVTATEFKALTGMDVSELPQWLSDASALTGVHKETLRLRNSGALARLEAARHARDAVLVAATIMRDEAMHASNRLNAATFIAKATGTERPIEGTTDRNDRFVIHINIGNNEPPVIIDTATRPIGTDTNECK